MDSASAAIGAAAVAIAGFIGYNVFLKKRLRAKSDERNKQIAEARQVDNPSKAFGEEVIEVLETQEALLKRHEDLPFHDLDYSAPMAGKTRDLYQETEAGIHNLRARWLDLQTTQEKLDKIAPADAKVSPEECAVIVDLINQCDRKGIRDIITHATTQLDRMQNAHEDIQPTLDRIAEHLTTIESNIDSLRDAGASHVPFETEWPEIQALAQTHITASAGDPLGSELPLTQARDRLREVRDLLDSLVAALQTAVESRQTIANVRQQVADLRAGGLPLHEPQANPDDVLLEAERELDVFDPAIRRGDVDSALNSIDMAIHAVDEAERRVKESVSSRTYAREELPRRRARQNELANERHTANGVVSKLEHAHARSAWQDILDAIARGDEQIIRVPELLDRAHTRMNDDFWLEAAELISQAQDIQAQVGATYTGPQKCLERLDQLATDCETLQADLRTRARDLDAFVDQHRRSLSDYIHKQIDGSRQVLTEIDDLERKTPADWPLIHRYLTEVQTILDDAGAEAREVATQFDALRAQAADLQVAADELQTYLAAQSGDRRQANDTHADADRELAALRRDLEHPAKAVETYERELDHVEHLLRQARQLAEEDIAEEHQARATLDQAHKTLQSVKAYYKHGISPRLGAAESAYRAAREAFDRQRYEDVARLAREAHAAANNAFEQAKADVQRKQAEVARRRSENMRKAATVGAMIGAQILGEVVRSRVHRGHRPYRRPSVRRPRYRF